MRYSAEIRRDPDVPPDDPDVPPSVVINLQEVGVNVPPFPVMFEILRSWNMPELYNMKYAGAGGAVYDELSWNMPKLS